MEEEIFIVYPELQLECKHKLPTCILQTLVMLIPVLLGIHAQCKLLWSNSVSGTSIVSIQLWENFSSGRFETVCKDWTATSCLWLFFCLVLCTVKEDLESNRVIRKVMKTQHENPETVIHGVRFRKNLQKSTLPFKEGWNSENHQLWWYLNCTLLHIISLLYVYNYYNYSPTLCIKCWVSEFHPGI